MASSYLSAASAAGADATAPAAPAQPPPTTTTVVAPPGSGGVSVVAPTPGGGSVVAQQCQSVTVNGATTLVGPGGGPCPTYAPYQPYQPYPYPAYGYPAYRPQFAPDPDRKAALLASTLVYSIGAGVTGILYLTEYAKDENVCSGSLNNGHLAGAQPPSNCDHPSARSAFVAYAAISAIVPSVPRFVVGDSVKGLIYTGLRGGSVLAAGLIDWGRDGSNNWLGPTLLGFAAPLTLAIVDLATTPHREELVDKSNTAAALRGPHLTSVAPAALNDRGGTRGAMLSLTGIF